MSLEDELIQEIQQPDISLGRLDKLLRKRVSVARTLLANPATTGKILDRIAAVCHSYSDIRLALVCHPNCPENILIKLGYEYPVEVYRHPKVIGNHLMIREIGAYALRKMRMEMHHKGLKSARLLAAHPATTGETLKGIADRYHCDKEVQLAIASNPNTPASVSVNLSWQLALEIYQSHNVVANNSIIYKMRGYGLAEVLMQPHLPQAFVYALLSHPDVYVATFAQLRWEFDKPSTQQYLNVFPEQLPEMADKRLTLHHIFASNDSTPEQVLEKVAKCASPNLLKLLAANPNVSSALFEELCKNYPEEVFKNPTIELRLIVNPELLSYIPDLKIALFLRKRDLPEHFLLFCANLSDNDIRTTAQFHVNLVGERVDNWQEVVKESLKKTALPWHKIVTVSFFKELMVDYPDILLGNLSLRRALAAESNLEIRLAMLLAEDSDEEVRSQLSQNPKVPKIALKKLAADRLSNISLNVAKNPNTPPEVLEDIANSGDDIYLKAIAGNPSTPSTVLRWLASFTNPKIRELVAANINTPKIVLAKLAKDRLSNVYSAVFRNPAIPRKWLVKAYFKRREDRDIRLAIAQNPNTPLEILKILLRDSNILTIYEALRNPNLSISLVGKVPYKDLAYPLVEAIINNPKTPDSCIRMMLEDLYQRDCLNDIRYYSYENIPKNFPVVFRKMMENYNLDLKDWEESIDTCKSTEYVIDRVNATREPSADRLILLSRWAQLNIK